jgi:hypothetical protein
MAEKGAQVVLKDEELTKRARPHQSGRETWTASALVEIRRYLWVRCPGQWATYL